MPIKYLHKWLTILTILLLVIPLSSQNPNTNQLDILLIQLEDALEKGNTRALRELAGIIDEVKDKKKVVSILKKHTLFPTEQIQLDTSLNRQSFFKFLNEYGDEIQYSPFLAIFFTKDIEDYETDFRILRKKNFSDKEKSSLLQRHADILTAASETQLEVFSKYQLQEIANLQTYESYDFLLGCLEGKNLNEDLLKTSYIKSNICEALTSFEDPYVLEIILEQLKKGNIEGEAAIRMLARFTNVELEETNPKKIGKQYMDLLDSLETLSGLRNYGFENQSTIRHVFFEESVDYYAYMLSQFYDNPWMRENALREMMATGNPRALFYLSAILFAERKGSSLDRKILENQLDRFLNISIELNQGEKYEGLKDNIRSSSFYLNHVIYWASHYSDYEFDSDRMVFVNVRMEEENEASATRLFKKLTSENDFEALEAYKELSRYSPAIIVKLYEKFQPVLRRANISLPDFRYGFLESIALLHEFCEIEGIELKISDGIQKDIDNLKGDLTIKERYRIENDLIQKLEIEEITALEIEALIYSKNIDFNFSMSRVLDVFYSEKFGRIAEDYFQMRLFLKKSILFSSIGIGGISNRYFAKLEGAEKKVFVKLENLSRKEYDSDIRDAIAYILPEDEENTMQEIPLGIFLDDPLEFGSRELSLVEKPNKKALKTIFKEINAAKNRDKVIKYIDYLFMHSSEELTPYIINGPLKNDLILSEYNGYERTVSDASVLLLENIYDFSFSKSETQALRESSDKWLLLHKKHKDFNEWQTLLFDKKVNVVLGKRKVLITELNEILDSELCTREIEKKCLSSLIKLDKPNNVRKLKLNHLLPFSDLVYFEDLKYKNKYLDNVLQLFEVDHPMKLFSFVEDFIENIPVADAGKIYNKLSDLNWFIPTVLKKNDDTRNGIIYALNTYLEEANFISEFEEKRIMNSMFLLKHAGESIDEQLISSKTYTDDIQHVFEIQQHLLGKISFEELPVVMNNLDALILVEGESSFSFLERKFGIPSYLLESEKNKETFQKDIQDFSEIEVYKKYLKLAGLDLFVTGNELDYEKVREVLEFDVVSPFSSTVSRNRMHYIIGVLRVLNELYPENHRLPMMEDEIRNQAQSWLVFLEEKGVFPSKSFYYSFNHEEQL